jgi:hypothetical protein
MLGTVSCTIPLFSVPSFFNWFQYGTFSKFVRPEQPTIASISDLDLDIAEVILCFRFAPATQIWRLVAGNEDFTRRLRKLWERRLINRFAFPFPRPTLRLC